MRRERTMDPGIGEHAAQAWETFHGTDEASQSEHREFGAWMMRSPEHIEGYLRVARTMQTLRSEQIRWPDTSLEVLVREAKAANDKVVTTLHSGPTARPRPRIVSRWALAAAATLLVAVAAGWFAWLTPQTYATGFGEQRFVRLEDGSGVTLNTASSIEVEFSQGHRVIRLVQGEALFDVAHDTARPFDVYSGKTILRAVGTRFDVDARAERTTVTVVEGVVSLTHGLEQALPLGNSPLLRASDQVVIDDAGPGTARYGVRVDEATAWTRQQLVFNNRKLGEVAEEFNRYNREHIVIASAELREQEITGVFNANDPASFVTFLSGIPGTRVERDRERRFVVTSGTASESRP
jgi:transmembrane sensor